MACLQYGGFVNADTCKKGTHGKENCTYFVYMQVHRVKSNFYYA